MKRHIERPSVTKALMRRITALALGLWLCMMCGITWVYARFICQEYEEAFYSSVGADAQNLQGVDPEYVKEAVLQQSVSLNRYNDFPFALELPFLDYDADVEPYEYAIACFDQYDVVDGVAEFRAPCLVGDGNIMHVESFMTSEDITLHSAYIDLDETQFGRELAVELVMQGHYYFGYYHLPEDIFNDVDNFRFDRLTGWFEGSQFHLVEIADYPPNVPLEQEPKDEWITVVDTAEPGQELVHLYPNMPNAFYFKLAATKPVRVNGVTYDDLGDMLENFVVKNGVVENRSSIFNAVLSSWDYFEDSSGKVYMICEAVQVSPLKTAISGLLIFYVETLLILAVVLLLIYRGIRKKLVTPMKYSLTLMTENPKYVPEPEEYWWEEAYELYVHNRDAIHELKKDINQLNTALDYARDAEENRRLMVSNITHELKTPLAVIHGYAEGLKEGIAADKRDHYLDVILEEAQRMDGMVLEMLDLSRLEAGKVRLATDRFSLLALTKRVVDKMSLLVEEKELTVEYARVQDCDITADEGRIAQAVTNLVSNAIKYSPRGGTVSVSVTREKNQAMFSIENQSEPLSEEALAKIWDSFYRTDKSRTEKGTGLGLPITKAIIELHGGTCHVSNTTVCQDGNTITGVEFKFYLP